MQLRRARAHAPSAHVAPPGWLVGATLLGLVLAGCGPEEGLPNRSVSTRADAILGGTVDRNDPAVVGIIGVTNQGMFVCTGSLIAPNLVITAHHCVADVGSAQGIACSDTFGSAWASSGFYVTTSYNAASAVFNGGRLPSIDRATWFGVRTIHVPPGNNSACGADMALLELSSNITSVCPAIPRVDSAPNTGETYSAIGFGVTSPNGQSAGTRYRIDGLSVLSNRTCAADIDTSLEWCGTDPRGQKGTCEGDSGGPAIDSLGRVLGAVSRGPSDCLLTVYSGVYGWRSWINSTMQTAASHGGFSLPAWVSGASTASPSSGFCADGGSISFADGGATGGGATTDGGAATSGECPSGLRCVDGSGGGDFACFDPSTADGFPADARTCRSGGDCPAGFDCWAASQTATTGSCIQTCTPGVPTPADAGTTTPSRDGGTSGGGTGGARDGGTNDTRDGGTSGAGAPGPCTGALSCQDATGQRDYLCVDSGRPGGVPSGASPCGNDGDCRGGSSCWIVQQGSATGYCFAACTPSATPPDGGPTAGATDGGSPTDGGTAASRGGCSAAESAPSPLALVFAAFAFVSLRSRRRRA